LKALRIASRKSQLALWQSEHVRARIQVLAPGRSVQIIPMSTQGDRLVDRNLAQAGGKGLFIKELEQALLEQRADIAVHSLKDVTVTIPDDLILGAICEREDPRDAFVSNRFSTLDDLPSGARVGTASLRRQCQLRARYPAIQVENMRGNVTTRLAKLDAGEFDAIVLAVAGLKRLEQSHRVRAALDPNVSLPAVGQGAICIECRAEDSETLALIQKLDHAATRICVLAERALNAGLDGGCQVPIGGYAELNGDQLRLRGLVGDPDGSRLLYNEIRGSADEAVDLGAQLARTLLLSGADTILNKVYGRT
jgi:hydroxymethylbilane synthase